MHIEFSGVSKSFLSSGLILKDFNLKIQRGEFLTLLGPSGCGKSTLLKLVAHLEKPSSGTLQILEPKKYDKGFVFQEAHLLPWLNVRKNIQLPLNIIGSTFESAQELIDKALKLV